MKINSIIRCLKHSSSFFPVFVLACLIVTGCQSTPKTNGMGNWGAASQAGTPDVVLKEADVVKVTFPSNESMNTIQTIRVDGKITLPIIGEVVAAGKTPAQLQKELIDQYSSQLVSAKEITVSVQSSSFNVFVTGAVMKSGKVVCDHPMTVLEAIMESGGFDYDRANLKAVRIIRNENGKTVNYKVNLKGIVNGSQIEQFYLHPNDLVYVPSKITWF